MLNTDRLLLGRSKVGYLVPFISYVRYVPSFIHGTQFFGTVKTEKYFKVIGYFMVNAKSQNIVNITSSNQKPPPL